MTGTMRQKLWIKDANCEKVHSDTVFSKKVELPYSSIILGEKITPEIAIKVTLKLHGWRKTLWEDAKHHIKISTPFKNKLRRLFEG